MNQLLLLFTSFQEALFMYESTSNTDQHTIAAAVTGGAADVRCIASSRKYVGEARYAESAAERGGTGSTGFAAT